MLCSNCKKLAVLPSKKICIRCKKPILNNLSCICDVCSKEQSICSICLKKINLSPDGNLLIPKKRDCGCGKG